MRRGLQIALTGLLVLAGTAIACLVWRTSCPRKAAGVVYRGKPLEAWFYGSRSNFFTAFTQKARREALKGVGTNAFPFLLETLERPQGSPLVYLRGYQAMPGWLKARMPYPISGDDIRAIALSDMWEMRDELTKEDLHALADSVPDLRNPRIRMNTLFLLNAKYQGNPPFRRLCRKLLDDVDPAIRLEAAIPLAEAAIVADPAEPSLAPMLLSALESKDVRQHWAEINGYAYRQWPPGSTPKPGVPPYLPRSYFADQDEMIRRRVTVALIRLEPYLTAEQKTRFEELEQLERTAKEQTR